MLAYFYEILYPEDNKRLVQSGRPRGAVILNEYLIWYNEERIKSTLNYMSPLNYRKSLGLIA
ncbi:MAG: IS3 family transposase [Lachnospiraceae bacterium]|nr:IS3 family transposase [Lachnospiraceae bacterium]